MLGVDKARSRKRQKKGDFTAVILVVTRKLLLLRNKNITLRSPVYAINSERLAFGVIKVITLNNLVSETNSRRKRRIAIARILY